MVAALYSDRGGSMFRSTWRCGRSLSILRSTSAHPRRSTRIEGEEGVLA